ncbi:uncharacterized protein LOC123015604 isoform X1 [Tribolium madens]|uniref:uncharacterized protein LOC123015604 isoform X1 n=1 Tax=Tribolium madens TaxID=41895 RepID=UPI001CF7639F|nr:uncharacterized protein LOC123015604 isoform X1 [Tribolium madens]
MTCGVGVSVLSCLHASCPYMILLFALCHYCLHLNLPFHLLSHMSRRLRIKLIRRSLLGDELHTTSDEITLTHFGNVGGNGILGILCMSLASPAWLSGTHFFLFVATTSFIGTLIWVFVYFLGIREALNLPIHWILTELVNTAICTGAYVIAFIVQLSIWPGGPHWHKGANIAAGVFGIFNALAYGFATYLLYIEYKGNRTN